AELKQTDATARLSSRLDVFAPSNANQEVSIENETLRIEFLRHPNGFAGARILTRKSNGWVQAAVWSPLFRVVNDTKSAEQARQISPGEARLTNASRNSVLFVQTARDADGVDWESLLRVSLETN